MNEKILLIHPGYGKAGTTTFQHLLKSLNVNILAKPTENQTRTIWFKLFKAHLFENKYEIKKEEYNHNKLKNDFKDYLKSFFNNQKRISVFSDEGLFGGLLSIHNYLGLYNLYIFKEIIEEVENELNIKIIIKFVVTIRRQYDMILSTYYYVGEYSELESPEDFFKRTIRSEDYKNLFDYTVLLKKIIKVFDPEILVLPLELLKKDQDKYIEKLCKFIDLEGNIVDNAPHFNKNYITKDNKKIYFFKRRAFSRIFYLASVTHNWLKKIEIYKKNFKNNTLLKIIYRIVRPKEKSVLSKYNTELFENEIKKLYKNNNLELEKMTNINLKELGYY